MIPGGVIAVIRDLQMWWMSQHMAGAQVATPSSQSLKSGKELQVSGFLQSMENSAASLLPSTAYGQACQSVSTSC